MATFLEICQKTAQLSGTVSKRNVLSVREADGHVARLIELVQTAWLEIQNEHARWSFLTVKLPSSTVLNQGERVFTPARFGLGAGDVPEWSEWILGLESDEVPLTIWPSGERSQEYAPIFTDYRSFRVTNERGAERERGGTPIEFSVNDDGNLVFWPAPDKVYAMAGTYRRSPQVLAADGDVPIIAAQFHDAIVWKALLLLREYEEADANVLITTGNALRKRMAPLRFRYLAPHGPAIDPHPVGGSGFFGPAFASFSSSRGPS